MLASMVVHDRVADWWGWSTNSCVLLDSPFGKLVLLPKDCSSPKDDETDFSEDSRCHTLGAHHVQESLESDLFVALAQIGFDLVHGLPDSLESSLAALHEYLNGLDPHKTAICPSSGFPESSSTDLL